MQTLRPKLTGSDRMKNQESVGLKNKEWGDVGLENKNAATSPNSMTKSVKFILKESHVK